MRSFFIPFIILVVALLIASAWSSFKQYTIKPSPSPIAIENIASPSASLIASPIIRSQQSIFIQPSPIQQKAEMQSPSQTTININQTQEAGQSGTPVQSPQPSPQPQPSSSNNLCQIVPGLPIICQ